VVWAARRRGLALRVRMPAAVLVRICEYANSRGVMPLPPTIPPAAVGGGAVSPRMYPPPRMGHAARPEAGWGHITKGVASLRDPLRGGCCFAAPGGGTAAPVVRLRRPTMPYHAPAALIAVTICVHRATTGPLRWPIAGQRPRACPHRATPGMSTASAGRRGASARHRRASPGQGGAQSPIATIGLTVA
jgi:hypothetical protein